MTTVYPSMVHLNGNLMAAVDLETTGLRANYHEPIQIAVVPLDSNFEPLADVAPFYSPIKPLFPERATKQAMHVHGMSMEDLVLHAPEPGRVADMLHEWWERLDLPIDRTLIPLAHNWAFECKFLQDWLGIDMASQMFHGHARDAMLTALHLNDRAAFMGEPTPFPYVGLKNLCAKFHIVNANPHDALCDCLAEAAVYKELIRYEI
jgi:DNA polymerase III epsilon subunit-like protein